MNTNQNIRHQQNLTDLRLVIVVLLSPAWPTVQHRTADVRQAIEEVDPGELLEVPI